MPDDPDMSADGDPSEAGTGAHGRGPTGALVIRVWLDGNDRGDDDDGSDGADEQLKARFLGRFDVERDRVDTPDYAIGVDDIVAKTRLWLLQFQRNASKG